MRTKPVRGVYPGNGRAILTPTPIDMPSGRSLIACINREPGREGFAASNAPSPCKVPTSMKRDPGRGLPIVEYSWCLWSHAICAGVRLLTV